MSTVLLLSGAGPYADPWHRFAETSDRLAMILGDLGHQVRLSDRVEDGLVDTRSSDSSGHLELIRRSVSWLLGPALPEA